MDDILGALRDSNSEICGICNSDILIGRPDAFAELVARGANDALLACVCTDVPAPEIRQGSPSKWGYDAFFFPQSFLGLYPETEFCLGVAAWDYWIPLVPLLKGIPVRLLDDPVLFHVEHEMAWQKESPKMIRKLTGYLQAGALCQPSSHFFEGALDFELGDLGTNYLSTTLDLFIKCHSKKFTADPNRQLEPAKLFSGFLKSSSFLYKEAREISRELDRVQGSFVWRVAQPLRQVYHWLRSLMGPRS